MDKRLTTLNELADRVEVAADRGDYWGATDTQAALNRAVAETHRTAFDEQSPANWEVARMATEIGERGTRAWKRVFRATYPAPGTGEVPD